MRKANESSTWAQAAEQISPIVASLACESLGSECWLTFPGLSIGRLVISIGGM